MDDTFEIKISRAGVNPENLKIGELAELLESIEESIKPLIFKENPELSDEQVVIGLTDIQTGSVRYKFKGNLPAIMLSWTILTSAIAEGNFSKLPLKSIKSLKKIATFSKKNKCSIEFYTENKPTSPAIIHPDTTIEIPAGRYLEGTTTIYGRVESVGGRQKPRVFLSLPKPPSLHCDVSEEMAIKLAPRLYTWVGVVGRATWNTDDHSIEAFEIEALTPFEDTPLSEAVKELSKVTGKSWKEEKDVIGAVKRLRGKM